MWWDDVERIELHRCVYPLNVLPDDLRHSVWETCQEPRLVPVLGSGGVHTTLVMPRGITIMDAHMRVDEWSRGYGWDTLIPLDYSTWIVFRQRLPDYMVTAPSERRR